MMVSSKHRLPHHVLLWRLCPAFISVLVSLAFFLMTIFDPGLALAYWRLAAFIVFATAYWSYHVNIKGRHGRR